MGWESFDDKSSDSNEGKYSWGGARSILSPAKQSQSKTNGTEKNQGSSGDSKE